MHLPNPQPVLCVQHGTELAVRVFGGTDVNVQLAWEDVYKKNEHTLSKRLPKYTVPTVPKHIVSKTHSVKTTDSTTDSTADSTTDSTSTDVLNPYLATTH
jgi:hypothetical protein